MAVQSQRAVRRLQRDLRALAAEPVEGVACMPDERNALLLHVNMVPLEGPYAGMPVHMHLEFPAAYPDVPPRVELCTRIRHPNVFSWGICLDMLREGHGPYSGWSAAYDVPAVLRQLYGFLLVDASIDQDYGGPSLTRTQYQPSQEELQQLRSQTFPCGYSQLPAAVAVAPTPTVMPMGSMASATEAPTQPDSDSAPVPEVPLDVVRAVMQVADITTVAKCAAASSAAGDTLAQLAAERQRELETRCFHSKEPLDTHTVLGYGVAVQRYRDGAVRSLSLAMDLLSHAAFTQGVRRSAWNFPFEAFLPLALNAAHAERALPLLDACLQPLLAGNQGSRAARAAVPAGC